MHAIRFATAILLCAPFTAKLFATPVSTVTTLIVTQNGLAVSSITGGGSVTLTATVLNGSTPVTPGTVNFCDAAATYCSDIHLLSTAQLTSAGTATIRFTPGVGSHNYKAVFSGTKTNASSASSSYALSVTGLVATSIVSTYTGVSGNYTLSASVGTIGSIAPTGQVSFLDSSAGSINLGSAGLSAGTAGLAFQNSAILATLSSPAVVGDFNGDGKTDLFGFFNPNYPYAFTTYLGNGDGSFSPAPETGPLNATGLVAGDFNNDGVLDVAASTGDGEIPSLLGNGDGTFTQVPDSPMVFGGGPLITADLNNDGNLDLAMPGQNNNLRILLGNGDGTFTAAASPKTGYYPTAIAVGNFNSDNVLDLAVTDGNDNNVFLLLGIGDGTFKAGGIIPTGKGPGYVVSADFNGDGKLDLAVSNYSGNSIMILLGNGEGGFTTGTTLAGPASTIFSQGIAVADINGDGVADLVVANNNPYSESILPVPINVWIGKGNGTFTHSSTTAAATGAEPTNLAVGDFNGDGRTDVAVQDYYEGQSSILLTANQTATAIINGIAPPSASDLPHVIATWPGDSSHRASASGGSTAVHSSLYIAPLSRDFGRFPIGGNSMYFSNTLANGGTQALDLTKFSFSLPDGSSFGLREQECGASLAPGAMCNFSLVFRPQAQGALTSNLQVFVGDNPAPVDMPLSGMGFGTPILAINPASLTFAPTSVGDTAAYQRMTLSNTGSGTLEISSLTLVSQYDAYSWGIREQTCGTEILPGASCTFSIAFRPTRVGELGAAIVLIDDNYNYESVKQSIHLRGTGRD